MNRRLERYVPKGFREKCFRHRSKKFDYNATLIVGIVWAVIIIVATIGPAIH